MSVPYYLLQLRGDSEGEVSRVNAVRKLCSIVVAVPTGYEIARIDEIEVTHRGDLRLVLRGRLPGDTVSLIVQRARRSVTLNARLAEVQTR